MGLASICDVADPTDLHPPQKREAGQRLAGLALANTYGMDLPAEGPSVTRLDQKGANLIVKFDPGAEAMEIRGDTWNDVEIAGADGFYHPGNATLSGNTMTVSAAAVPTPIAVRYGWSQVFVPSLFNTAGLPTAPFAIHLDHEGTLQFGLVRVGA